MVDQAAIPISGIILAGGIGSRFWPLSRSQYPKQVLRLLGSESMIQSTIERLLPLIPLERLLVVTNAGQSDVISLELRRKGWQGIRLILEPEGRNTAPAVGVAAALLGEDPAGLMAVFPADHFIRDPASLLAALAQGAVWAAAGYLVTFGIPPAVRKPAMAISSRGRLWGRPGPALPSPGLLRSRIWPGPRPFWTKGAITGTVASSCFAGMFYWLPWRSTCRRCTGGWSA